MITQIKGRLVEKSPTELVIDCNGLGYLVNISLNTFSLLSDSENISLYTHLQVKEDSHTLFGFYEKTERNLFRKLISCLLYTSPSPRDRQKSRMPSSA